MANLCGALLLCMISFTRAESYYGKDLGTLGGNSSQAYAEQFRQVVGYSSTSNNVASHAVLFSGTGSNNIDLVNLGGNSNNLSEARSINDSGQIVGWAVAPSGYFEATFFTGTGTGNVDLGNLYDSGGGGSEAWGINNSGTIVGDAYSCAGGDRATLYSGTGTGNIDLGGIGGGISGLAFAINASGQIAGSATRLDAAQHATLFSGSGSNNVGLGTLGGFNSNGYGINDAGQVVGSALTTYPHQCRRSWNSTLPGTAPLICPFRFGSYPAGPNEFSDPRARSGLGDIEAILRPIPKSPQSESIGKAQPSPRKGGRLSLNFGQSEITAHWVRYYHRC